MAVGNKPDFDSRHGHRMRLRQKLIDGKLADYELLELLLTFAIPRRDVRELARGLERKYGGLHQVLAAPYDELLSYPGLGPGSATYLKAIQAALLTSFRSNLDARPVYSDPNILTSYCRMLLTGKDVEEFHVMYFDAKMHMIADDVHSRGTIDQSPVYPREIVKRALDLNARSVLLLHNHPTPHTSFSTQDIELTTEISRILKAVDVNVYDHYVVSGAIVYSARAMFLLQ